MVVGYGGGGGASRVGVTGCSGTVGSYTTMAGLYTMMVGLYTMMCCWFEYTTSPLLSLCDWDPSKNGDMIIELQHDYNQCNQWKNYIGYNKL